jgi:hypothetical protein
MTQQLKVYRTGPDGDVLAVTIVAGDDGAVRFVPGDGYAEQAMRMLEGGVLVYKPTLRAVMPDDGPEFLSAVREDLLRSSAWRTEAV